MHKRLRLSNPFWANFKVQDRPHRKKMGLCKVENVDNPNICTLAVNLKEYFKNRSINKKHKGVRKDNRGISFEAYAERYTPLKTFDEKINQKKMVQKRFQVKNSEMKMNSIC